MLSARQAMFASLLLAPALVSAQAVIATTHPAGGIPDRHWGSTFSYDCVPEPLLPGGLSLCRPVDISMRGEPGTSWSVLSGSLPQGVVLRPDGKFEGFPTEMGEVDVVIQALGNDPAAWGTRAFHFRVKPARERCLPPLGVGAEQSICCFCSGPTRFSVSVLKGALPEGMRYENRPSVHRTTAGYLVGTPVEAGVFHHVGRCRAEDGSFVSSWPLTITVENRPNSIAGPLTVTYCRGAPAKADSERPRP
jgi:hypothetical protein